MAAYKPCCFGLLRDTRCVSMVAPGSAPDSAAGGCTAPAPRWTAPRGLAPPPSVAHLASRAPPPTGPRRQPRPPGVFVSTDLIPSASYSLGRRQGVCTAPEPQRLPHAPVSSASPTQPPLQAAGGPATELWVPRSPPLGAPGINKSQPRGRSCNHTRTRASESAHAEDGPILVPTNPGGWKSRQRRSPHAAASPHRGPGRP